MGGGGEVAQRQAISGYNEGRAGTIGRSASQYSEIRAQAGIQYSTLDSVVLLDPRLRGDFGRGWWIGGG
jgi:hypothetical protein